MQTFSKDFTSSVNFSKLFDCKSISLICDPIEALVLDTYSTALAFGLNEPPLLEILRTLYDLKSSKKLIISHFNRILKRWTNYDKSQERKKLPNNNSPNLTNVENII